MRFEGLFFDLYGTLLIYGDMSAAWSGWLAELRQWLNDLGLRIDEQDLAQRCDGFFSRPEPELCPDGLTIYENRLRELTAGLGLEATNGQLSLAAGTTAAAWQKYLHLDPEALSVLSQVSQGRSLALISNFDHPPHVRSVLEETGLDRCFDVVVISGEAGVKKPDPRILSLPLAKLDLAPEQVAFVGDAPEDIQAAQAAGILPIRIHRKESPESAGAADFRQATRPVDWGEAEDHKIIASLNELPALLAGRKASDSKHPNLQRDQTYSSRLATNPGGFRMSRHDSLYFHEELMLLALRDEEGTIEMGSMVHFAVGGAVLAELLIRERIRLDSSSKNKPVHLLNAKPIGEPLLDECLTKIGKARKQASAQTWVSRFGGIKELTHRVARDLCDRRILGADEDKILLLFKRRIYPEIDPKPEKELIERLRRAIFIETDRLDARTVVLISLAHSAGLLNMVFDKKELKARQDRIESIVSGDALAEATKSAIEAVRAAMFVACVMPVIITTSVTH